MFRLKTISFSTEFIRLLTTCSTFSFHIELLWFHLVGFSMGSITCHFKCAPNSWVLFERKHFYVMNLKFIRNKSSTVFESGLFLLVFIANIQWYQLYIYIYKCCWLLAVSICTICVPAAHSLFRTPAAIYAYLLNVEFNILSFVIRKQAPNESKCMHKTIVVTHFIESRFLTSIWKFWELSNAYHFKWLQPLLMQQKTNLVQLSIITRFLLIPKYAM